VIAARIVALVLGLTVPTALTLTWVGSAKDRLHEMTAAPGADGAEASVAVAAAADEAYCTPQLKRILRRVLHSCGLLGSGATRGCQPVEARNVATMAGDDFNALFTPMRERGGIVQFDAGTSELDADDSALIDQVFADQQGASYFFVVARASPDGSAAYNRDLSRDRAEAVMDHLRTTFDDPDLDGEVGLLWLGEEFAQLETGFCDWRRSGDDARCRASDINRSAFIAWIDCRL
jgi:outer membrane protein OmpA-like peptidoglycan-associated protein